MNYEQTLQLCKSAHAGQYRRPKHLTEGPEGLITDGVMSIMMYNNITEPAILPDGSKLTYSRHLKQWHSYEPYHTHPIAVADMFHNISSSPTDRQKTKYYKGIKYLLATL